MNPDVVCFSNIIQEIARITRDEAKIPSILHTELSLMYEFHEILKPIQQADEKGKVKLLSSVFPGLEIIIWNKVGWKLE